MFAALFPSIALLAVAPVCPTAAADIAVTEIRLKVVRQRLSDSPDHYIVTGVVTNTGGLAQTPGIGQSIALVRDGRVLATQAVPALGAGVAYTVAFAVDRPRAERGAPFPATLRYHLERGDRLRNDCSGTNNTLSQTL